MLQINSLASNREKMYKNKFKSWRWSKNLSHERAMWMNEKIKQRHPTATVFQWNHQEWSEDQVMQICGRVAQVQPQTSQRPISKTVNARR
jgi:hypothetical protein